LGAAVLIEKQYGLPAMDLENTAPSSLLAQRDQTTFERLFKTYFKQLHAYAFTMLRDEADAEEMVQQVFFKLWERNETLSVSGAAGAYLYRAVHNESLNFIKHRKVKSSHQLHVAYSMKNEVEHPAKKIIAGELEKKIHAALEELPEQCRSIFQLSRFEELKYREIAGKLGISVKTVENQMGKALKLLRLKLADFLVFFILFFNL
jgi:RNA polymerase sigma-70 factor (ECF subfamily)